jgi:hypothetical protein
MTAEIKMRDVDTKKLATQRNRDESEVMIMKKGVSQ